MQTETKSKNVKPSPKKEFLVESPGTGAARIAEAAEIKPGKIPTESMAAISILQGVSSEERYQLIAEAAYFRAERRNFAPGCELEDWLSAEAEIEMRLSKISPDNPLKNA